MYNISCFIEHISSQAKVLDDGSVMYKYLNPNLVVMVTQSRDPSKRKGQYLNLVLLVCFMLLHFL